VAQRSIQLPVRLGGFIQWAEKAMTKIQHTPLPWFSEAFDGCDEHTQIGIADIDGNIIAKAINPHIAHEEDFTSELEENAAFIITACNAHYELLSAMQGAIDALSQDKTFPADIVCAKNLLSRAITKVNGGAA
jgi:hypothetical protein